MCLTTPLGVTNTQPSLINFANIDETLFRQSDATVLRNGFNRAFIGEKITEKVCDEIAACCGSPETKKIVSYLR